MDTAPFVDNAYPPLTRCYICCPPSLTTHHTPEIAIGSLHRKLFDFTYNTSSLLSFAIDDGAEVGSAPTIVRDELIERMRDLLAEKEGELARRRARISELEAEIVELKK